MNNSLLRKTIQNNRKRKVIHLVTTEKTRNRLTSLVNLKGSKYISDFLQIFEMKKKKQWSKKNGVKKR